MGGGDFGSGSGSKFNCAARVGLGQTISGTGRVRASVLSSCRPLRRAKSALPGHAYSAAGQLASALHSMAVLQVFQAKMLASEEAGLDAASFRDLRNTADLALRATKATVQAIGQSMSSLIVLERHLWLTMTEMKEAYKVKIRRGYDKTRLYTPIRSKTTTLPWCARHHSGQ